MLVHGHLIGKSNGWWVFGREPMRKMPLCSSVRALNEAGLIDIERRPGYYRTGPIIASINRVGKGYLKNNMMCDGDLL